MNKPRFASLNALRPYRRVASFLLTLLAFLSLPQTLRAETEVDISFGFENSYAAGVWTPLRMTFENRPDKGGGGADFTGNVEVRVSDYHGTTLRYTRELELPLQSRKVVEMEVMLSANSPIVVELIDEKNVKRLEREVTPPSNTYAFSSLRHSTYVVPTVLVLQPATGTYTLPFTLENSAANIRGVRARALPSDYKSYDGVRLLVVRGHLEGTLRTDQLEALDQWLRLGGQLAVIASRNSQAIRDDPWLKERLPVLPSRILELPLKALDPEAGEAMVSVATWEALPPAEQVFWNSPAGALAVQDRYGSGAISVLGVDPSSFGPAELATPVGRRAQALLDVLVLGPQREDLRARHLWSTADIDPGFQDVMILPNLLIVTLLIVLFVIVVGPLNFFLLRRRRRLELAWATIPGLSILFFFAVYAYGAAAKGGDQHFASSDILHVSSGSSSGLLLSGHIQFAPRKTTYRIRSGENGTTVPLLQYYDDPSRLHFMNFPNPIMNRGIGTGPADRGRLATLRHIGEATELLNPVEQWTMQFYQTEVPVELNGAVTGSVELLNPGSVRLVLHNGSEYPLREAVLYLGEETYPVDPIAPGESIDSTLKRGAPLPLKAPNQTPPRRNHGDDFSNSADYLIRQGGARAYPLFDPQNPQRRARLMAWIPEWESLAVVEPEPDARKSHGLIEVALPVVWKGTRTLTTANYLRRQVYSVDSLNTQLVDATAQIFCRLRDSGVEVLVGNAWEGAHPDFQGGTLSAKFTPHTEHLAVQVYNYAEGRWVSAYHSERDDRVRLGQPEEIDIPIRHEWVNPVDPMVRIRLQAQPQSTSGSGGGTGNIFSGNYGVEVTGLEGLMALRGTGIPNEDDGDS